jgi:predicted nuclease of predicted toxin-antitoxin system
MKILLDGNRTTDTISDLADQQGRVVFSKDADFVQSHLLQATPKKLLVIATGNIRNPEPAQLVLLALPSLNSLFAINNLIELHRTALIIRR